MSSRTTDRPPRPACSEAERVRAAQLIVRLDASGRKAQLQPFWTRPAWPLVQAACAAGGVLASVLSVGTPLTGLIVALTALLLALGDSTRLAPLRRLTPSRASQNVVSVAPEVSPRPAVTLILTAAIDDRRSPPSDKLPQALIATNAALIVLIAGCAAIRLAGFDALALAIVQLVPTLLLLGAILVFLSRNSADCLPDDSAVDAVLAIAKRLDAEPPQNLRVAVVLAGAGNAQAAGLRHWLRSRRRNGIRAADVAILAVEPCAAGQPVWWERDGVVLAAALHPQLRRAAEAAAKLTGAEPAEPTSGPDATAAGVARGDNWPGIAIGARSTDELSPAAASSDTQAAVAEFGEQLVRQLDSDLAAAADSR